MMDAKVLELLDRCETALNDWVHVYASEMCSKQAVSETRARICDNGGTLAYIGKLLVDIRKARGV